VNSNVARMTADADLLELAHSVEQCVPADIERAQECLRSLQAALSVHEHHARTRASSGQLDPSSDAERLRALVARIAYDVAGGHVLGVNGLERQIRYYVEHSRLR